MGQQLMTRNNVPICSNTDFTIIFNYHFFRAVRSVSWAMGGLRLQCTQHRASPPIKNCRRVHQVTSLATQDPRISCCSWRACLAHLPPRSSSAQSPRRGCVLRSVPPHGPFSLSSVAVGHKRCCLFLESKASITLWQSRLVSTP